MATEYFHFYDRRLDCWVVVADDPLSGDVVAEYITERDVLADYPDSLNVTDSEDED